ATDKAAIEAARLQIDYATIRAPIGGRLGKIAPQRGNLVRSADASPLGTINPGNPIYSSFRPPQKTPATIRAPPHRGAPPVLAQRPDSERMTGKLGFIDNAVDATTGTIKLRATFDNPKSTLWPGQFVNVSLELGEDEGALVVAPAAVLAGPEGPYLYVV